MSNATRTAPSAPPVGQVAPSAAPPQPLIPTPIAATPEAPAAAPVVETVDATDEKPFSDSEKVPSNWGVVPVGSGIIATHCITLRVFKGSIKGFNAMLKG